MGVASIYRALEVLERLELVKRIELVGAGKRFDVRGEEIRALAPILKMAMAYPLRARFRTGVTLAMFTLVVFTIVVLGLAIAKFKKRLG